MKIYYVRGNYSHAYSSFVFRTKASANRARKSLVNEMLKKRKDWSILAQKRQFGQYWWIEEFTLIG